jgi:prephenate dehydrogenase (NADP+)
MLIFPQLFRLWLGVTEYLFRNPELLEEALDTAIDDNTFRSDDLEFTFAARVSNPNCVIILPHSFILLTMAVSFLQAWSDCVSFGDFESYRDRFERIASYFAPRFPEASQLGNEMMKTILEKTTNNP